MFYIDDDENSEEENGFNGKTGEELDNDLFRIVSSGFGNNEKKESQRVDNEVYGGGKNSSVGGGLVSKLNHLMDEEDEPTIINSSNTPMKQGGLSMHGNVDFTPSPQNIHILNSDGDGDDAPILDFSSPQEHQPSKPTRTRIQTLNMFDEEDEDDDVKAVHSEEEEEEESFLSEDNPSTSLHKTKKGGKIQKSGKHQNKASSSAPDGEEEVSGEEDSEEEEEEKMKRGGKDERNSYIRSKQKGTSRRIVMHPVPKDYGIMRCCIVRDKGKLKLFPRFYLYEETSHGSDKQEDTFLLAAKKRKANKTSNYCLCLKKEDLRRESSSYVGKLRSNILGTRFYMYDRGSNETTKNKGHPLRKQLGGILYEANFLGTKGPRKMTTIIPRINDQGKYKSFPDKPNAKLIDMYKEKGDWSDIMILKNKGPSWNDGLKAYVLDFNGRVTKPSVKNFQLVNPHNNDLVILQFGRVSSTKFTLDFRYPLSPFQAFCIALSAFDKKLACE